METSDDSSYISERSINVVDEWFPLILQRFQLGVFIYQKTTVVWINNWLEDFLGQPKEEIIGRSVESFIEKLTQYNMDSVSYNTIKYSEQDTAQRQMAIYDPAIGMFRLEIIIDELSFDNEKLGYGIVADISNFKILQQELQASQKQVEMGKTALQKKKIAFDEVLSTMEEHKAKTISKLTNYLEQKVSPVLRQLKESADESQMPLINLLEEDLRAISVDFNKRMASQWSNLTSRELQVCHMIRNGYSSKEIATALGLCLSTIHKHRETIRKKLGIRNKHINLNSYLRKI